MSYLERVNLFLGSIYVFSKDEHLFVDFNTIHHKEYIAIPQPPEEVLFFYSVTYYNGVIVLYKYVGDKFYITNPQYSLELGSDDQMKKSKVERLYDGLRDELNTNIYNNVPIFSPVNLSIFMRQSSLH